MADVFIGSCNVGLGLFAARAFGAGERILDFEGPERSDPRDGSPAECNLLQLDVGRYMLPNPPGLFVNHSCAPNAALVGGLSLVATRPIAAYEEVRFDYSTSMLEDPWQMECACGEPGCRGVVEEFGLLPRDDQRRFLAAGHVPDFIAERYARARHEDPAIAVGAW
ncbi:MAG: SET domain-containing protein [Myxococcales bacterium]|nr:SET domain-containing protein [Myxococcales bacterium]MCB9736565.1 SET domain-containing protein [Deltaproteobacteria bacterium]